MPQVRGCSFARRRSGSCRWNFAVRPSADGFVEVISIVAGPVSPASRVYVSPSRAALMSASEPENVIVPEPFSPPVIVRPTGSLKARVPWLAVSVTVSGVSVVMQLGHGDCIAGTFRKYDGLRSNAELLVRNDVDRSLVRGFKTAGGNHLAGLTGRGPFQLDVRRSGQLLDNPCGTSSSVPPRGRSWPSKNRCRCCSGDRSTARH